MRSTGRAFPLSDHSILAPGKALFISFIFLHFAASEKKKPSEPHTAGVREGNRVYFDFGNALIFLVFSALFVLLTLLISRIIRPSAPSSAKESTYECGEVPFGGSWIQFNLRFYVIALVFLIFEVEVIFLFPWAVVLRRIGMFALVEMLIFVGILIVGLAYVWRKKDLTWVLAPEARMAESEARPQPQKRVRIPEGVIRHEGVSARSRHGEPL